MCLQNKEAMYSVGSLFYAIYFFVSFPMFFVMDELTRRWSLWQAAVDSLAAGMLVTILLDIWRLLVGNIHAGGDGSKSGASLPWL